MTARRSLLGLDTVSSTPGVALVVDGELAGSHELPANGRASSHLLDAVSALIREHGLSPANLSSVAVTTGPGSLTGIRVGIAFVKGLLHDSSTPCADILTFDAIERQRGDDCGLPIVQLRKTEWLVRSGAHVLSLDESGVRALIEERGSCSYIGAVPDHSAAASSVRVGCLAAACAFLGWERLIAGAAISVALLAPSYYTEPYAR